MTGSAVARDPGPEVQPAAVPAPGWPGRYFRSARARRAPWPLFSRISPARRIALALVAVFDVFEVVLLSARGFQQHNWVALMLGLVVLLILLGFERAEHAAMRRDHELSQEISEWLLPPSPLRLMGLEAAFIRRMAKHVGTDYFNVFPRWSAERSASSHRLFIVMADVAGTGLQGALLMATFQASLRVLADSRMPLAELASQMNQWCWDRSIAGRHFTMAFLADLDPETGSLQYVSAGHQPPVVSRANGQMELLETGGFPLGVLSGSVYETGSTVLAFDDALVIFSDGVVNAENHRGELFGVDRVIHSLGLSRGLTADEILNQLGTSMLCFCGSAPQPDDHSFVVVRRCPLPAHSG